jgi:hypothetical protein
LEFPKPAMQEKRVGSQYDHETQIPKTRPCCAESVALTTFKNDHKIGLATSEALSRCHMQAIRGSRGGVIAKAQVRLDSRELVG